MTLNQSTLPSHPPRIEYHVSYFYKSFLPGTSEAMSLYWGTSPFVEDMTNLMYEDTDFSDPTWLEGEGMIYPGVKLISRGEPIPSVFDILTANCRMPDFLIGDLWAGVAAVRVGERRIL